MPAVAASPVRLDKERVDHLVRLVKELLRRHLRKGAALDIEERLAAEAALSELWERLGFLTHADVTKLLLRDVFSPRHRGR